MSEPTPSIQPMPSDAPHLRTLPVDDQGVFEFSASAIGTKRDCRKKYFYSYAMGLRQEANASAALGTEIHSQMENWLLSGAVPEHPAAKRLLPLAPLPTHAGLRIEHPFRLLFPVGVARGFIDVLIPQPDLQRLPDLGFAANVPIVIDWKSTSRLEYAKSEEELLKDPQAVLYGVEARRELSKVLGAGVKLKDIPEVDLNWNYTSTKRAEVKPVRLRQTLTILEDGLAEVLEDARQMSLDILAPGIGDVPHNLDSCEKYGGCPHRAYCPAFRDAHGSVAFGNASDVEASDPPKEKQSMSDILARLSAAAKKKTPIPVDTPKVVVEASTTETTPSAVKVTPEPSLPVTDVSALDTPLPAGTSPIVPPDAPANVSPNDPPAPLEATEVLAAEKPKRGRPKGSTKAQPAAAPEVLDAEVSDVTTDLSAQEINAFLTRVAGQALRQGRLNLATASINTLYVVQQGG